MSYLTCLAAYLTGWALVSLACWAWNRRRLRNHPLRDCWVGLAEAAPEKDATATDQFVAAADALDVNPKETRKPKRRRKTA